MKHFILFSIFTFGAAHFLNAQSPRITHAGARNTEMGFVENKGQLTDQDGNPVPDVFFKSEGTGPAIYITSKGLTYVFDMPGEIVSGKEEEASKVRMNWAKVNMLLEGAHIRKENIVCEDELPGYSNFYYPHCPMGILHVKSYHKITIKNIYPGIDWVFNADSKKGMAHDFVIHPGAHTDMLRIRYEGTNEDVSMDKNHVLKIATHFGTIYEGGLKVYRQDNGKIIKSKFRLQNNRLSFDLGNYPKNSVCIIDPPLQWSMPQASTNFDYGYSVTASKDATGDILVTGATDGTDFPVINAYQGLLYGFEDMVVERLNTSGTRLWSTYYGGTDYEQGKSVASDVNGNCYVTGNTGSTDFPVLTPAQAGYGGGVYDVAILKFNSAGVRQWATWYGGLQNDYGTALTADAAGDVYVTGYTSSSAFPVSSAVQGTKNFGYDAFIIRLNTNASVQWATFYGGDDDDKARAITIDDAGNNILITGTTLSGGFPVTAGTFQSSSNSAYNAEEGFILKMSTAEAVQWCTYFGGSDADFGQGITTDPAGNVFVTGYTLSSDFPIVNPGNGAHVDSTIASLGTHDAFVLSCNANGASQTWGTYFGGTMPDMGFAIAYDQFVGIYICGNTSSTDFPTHQPIDNNFYQSVQGDGGIYNDMFIAWFDTNDSLRWSTYYGATTSDEAYGICVDGSNNIFVTGVSNDNLEVTKFGPGVPTEISQAAIGYPSVPLLFPNPAKNHLYCFPGHKDELVKFEIYDNTGRLVRKQESFSNGEAVSIDIADFAAGVYMIKIISAEISVNRKFIKE